MASITKIYTAATPTQARADGMNDNFTQLADFFNNNVQVKGAQKDYTVAPTLPATDPSNRVRHAVRKSFVDKGFPFKPQTAQTGYWVQTTEPSATSGKWRFYAGSGQLTTTLQSGYQRTSFGISQPFTGGIKTVVIAIGSNNTGVVGDYGVYAATGDTILCFFVSSALTVFVNFLIVGWDA